MNGFGLIVSGLGLQDGLNPGIFMTCAIFIVLRQWLAAKFSKSIWLPIFFVLAYAAGFLDFSFGPAQVFLLKKNFFTVAKYIYFVLGASALVAGIVFLKDWFFLNRERLNIDPPQNEVKYFRINFLILRLIVVIPALMLSAFATVWPVNNYILLLGNGAFLKGQWVLALPSLIAYVLVSMWPLWFVWAFLSIKGLKPTMAKIFIASIFITASSCMILIFK